MMRATAAAGGRAAAAAAAAAAAGATGAASVRGVVGAASSASSASAGAVAGGASTAAAAAAAASARAAAPAAAAAAAGSRRALSAEKRLDFYRFETQDLAETKRRNTDEYNRHQQILPLGPENAPLIAPDAFVAPSATVVGNVEVWDKASVWNNAVVKGDTTLVRIGAYTNVQDDAVVEEAASPLSEEHDGSTIIGHYVTIGHRAVLRACTIEDECVVGMGSVLLEGSYMETQSQLAAGSVLAAGDRIPSGQLWAGNPAQRLRDLTEGEKEKFKVGAEKYRVLAGQHKDEFFLPGHAHLDAEKLGIKVGWQEHPDQ